MRSFEVEVAKHREGSQMEMHPFDVEVVKDREA
jgi:hypothetical protein